jgi:hypothetical protein
MSNLVTFGEAIEAAKQGKRIARIGWNGKGMFVFQRPEDILDIDMVVNRVKSLPLSVKDFFGRSTEQATVKFTAYLCMYAADKSIVNGWLASQTDMLATDWVILD